MSAIAAFVLGLLVGWLIEWIIDWLYWRRKQRELQASLRAQSRQLASLEEERTGLARQLKESKDIAVRVPETTPAQEAELAQLRETSNRLETENARLRSQITAWEAENAQRATRTDTVGLDAAVPEPVVTPPVVLPPGIPVPAAVPVGTAGDMPQDTTPAAIDVPDERRGKVSRDDLEVIRGIGPVIAGLLYQNGINTFQDLAAMTPERLRELVGDRIQRLADENSIIEQARTLAAAKKLGV